MSSYNPCKHSCQAPHHTSSSRALEHSLPASHRCRLGGGFSSPREGRAGAELPSLPAGTRTMPSPRTQTSDIPPHAGGSAAILVSGTSSRIEPRGHCPIIKENLRKGLELERGTQQLYVQLLSQAHKLCKPHSIFVMLIIIVNQLFKVIHMKSYEHFFLFFFLELV